MVKKAKEIEKKPIIEEIIEKMDEVVEETTIVYNDNHKAVDYEGRGFKTIEEAFAFVETPYFKGLGEADQEEYIKWLY